MAGLNREAPVLSNAEVGPREKEDGRTRAKPRVAFADLAWMSAFEKVKQLGEGATVGDYKVVWIYDEPPICWLQVKIGKTKRMIRKGDTGIFDLIAAR